MCVCSEEGMRMELHFIKGKESESVLELVVSQWRREWGAD